MTSPTFALALPQLGLIRVAGADADAFLQGQLSNDIRRLSATQAQLTSLNSAKGRLLAILHAMREGEDILLELHRSILDSMLKRLRMYVLRSKVTLVEAGDRAIFGLAGPDAAAVLERLGLPAPQGPLACGAADGTSVVRRLGAVPRYTILFPVSRAPEFEARLAALTTPAQAENWQALDLEAGVPTIYPQTQDRFVAQMCNLDTLDGISFDKGCYTGQEVIARVHYRGAVKRHMNLLRLPGPAPEPGAKLDAGEVVDAVMQPDGSALALVVTSP